ncbi:MAG TPA: LamG domain-containing protein [Kofleriaceae bacterium]|nr:LamG domain-containing protein [Kofleriaceae bacterium]
MVLSRIVLATLLLTGCKLSLFADHGGGDDIAGDANDNGDVMVQSSCGAMCLGDAGADLGKTGTKWRYLDDHRDRTWTPMTAAGTSYVGANTMNKFSPCAGSSAAACTMLPGALLVSTAGKSDAADPALEFSSSSNQVIKISLRVYIENGGDHMVRLYRNAREDSLYTFTATQGNMLETSITLDALAGERFLLALAPTNAGAQDIGVQLFINGTTTVFPQECQMALQFNEAATGNMIPNPCGGAALSRHYNMDNSFNDVDPTQTAGPFPEMGMAASLTFENYYRGGDIMDRMGDTTTQFWVRQDMEGTENAVLVSDDDLDKPGGLAVYKLMGGGNIGAQTCVDANTLEHHYFDAPYPAPANGWHFVRVIQAGTAVRICVDGVRLGSYVLAAGAMQSDYPLFVGKNGPWLPAGAFFQGAIDDVRVLKGALPCN